jgi:two-component system phosphate regulon sensor histidine kinase PhoR
MFPQRFFWKVFLSLLASILVFAIFFDFLLYRTFSDRTLEALKSNLKKETEILTAFIVATPSLLSQPKTIVDVVHSGDRITLIRLDGTVLGDNWAERLGIEAMENHRTRPEVQSAIAGHPIFIRRYSHTIQTEMLYYAVPININGQDAVILRLSFALTTFHEQMAAVRNFLITANGIAILLLLPITYLISRSVQRPIERLRVSARKMASGDLQTKIEPYGSLEFQELARGFNLMSAQLQQKIQNIQQQHNRNEALLSKMVEGVLAIDRHGKAVFANAAFGTMVGLRVEGVQGKSYLEITRNNQLSEYISSLLRQEAPLEAREIQLYGPEGQKDFAVQASRIQEDDRGVVMVLLVFHDITRIKRVEQIRKDFVANVSHELRTPLTAIKGSTELLLDGAYQNPESCRKFLEIMDKQLQNIQNLVSDMLNLAAAEETGISLHRKTFELQSLIKDVVAIIQPLAEKKKQALQVFLPEKTIELNADPKQLSDALINLLDNAVKYTQDQGTIELMVRRNSGSVLLEVRDNGQGIAADQLPRIFERFYRIDKSRSREMGGTGLGLAIVKHAIENHGGTVSVRSDVGRGSTFTISLPVN